MYWNMHSTVCFKEVQSSYCAFNMDTIVWEGTFSCTTVSMIGPVAQWPRALIVWTSCTEAQGTYCLDQLHRGPGHLLFGPVSQRPRAFIVWTSCTEAQGTYCLDQLHRGPGHLLFGPVSQRPRAFIVWTSCTEAQGTYCLDQLHRGPGHLLQQYYLTVGVMMARRKH